MKLPSLVLCLINACDLEARYLTYAAYLPNQEDGEHPLARHLTHANHHLNQKNGELSIPDVLVGVKSC